MFWLVYIHLLTGQLQAMGVMGTSVTRRRYPDTRFWILLRQTCCTTFNDSTAAFTHTHVWNPDGKLASKYSCMYTGERLFSPSDAFYRMKADAEMAGTITMFTFPSTASQIYTQSENYGVHFLWRGRRGFMIWISFQMSSSARISRQFDSRPSQIQDLGIFFFFFFLFWMQANTFPSVREICSSSRCIGDQSFCSVPKPKSQLTYHSWQSSVICPSFFFFVRWKFSYPNLTCEWFPPRCWFTSPCIKKGMGDEFYRGCLLSFVL